MLETIIYVIIGIFVLLFLGVVALFVIEMLRKDDDLRM